VSRSSRGKRPLGPAGVWWTVYAAIGVLVLTALLWVTVTVVRLERAETDARADADHQEALRLALWRVDSWLAPRLAREAARPAEDYQAFYPQRHAYTRMLYQIEPGDVLIPSPLLTFESELFPLHFQMTADGELTSPQAPVGSVRERIEGAWLSAERIDTNRALLDDLGGRMDTEKLVACVSGTAPIQGMPPDPPPRIAAVTPPPPPVPVKGESKQEVQQARTKKEWSARQGVYMDNVAGTPSAQVLADPPVLDDEPPLAVGPLIAFWSEGPTGESEAELMFVRQVRVGERSFYQGFVADWPNLRAAMLGQVADLFAGARLVPAQIAPAAAESGTRLATIPVVALDVPSPIAMAITGLTPARLTLVLTWLAVIAGAVAVAVMLRASIAYGDRRSRFASAVTHELRTPLTTFRLYTEMLADGMIEDEAKRQSYLETLKSESGRLAALVENVLCYAQLEEGRRTAQRSRVTLGELWSRVVPPLARRVQESGMTLELSDQTPPETAVTTDVDAVGQILLNLVDNACKYAPDAPDRTVRLRVDHEEGRVAVSVEDGGPGVPAVHARTIFAPFERCRASAEDAAPGVGLGLALARGLARSLGGDLRLVAASSGSGACFRLTLPSS